MKANPANLDFYWIYFMLFPTLVHFALAGASVLLWYPEQLRHSLLQNWQHDADKKLGIWLYVSVMPVLGFIIAPTALLYGLWCLLGSVDLGNHLITLFQKFV